MCTQRGEIGTKIDNSNSNRGNAGKSGTECHQVMKGIEEMKANVVIVSLLQKNKLAEQW